MSGRELHWSEVTGLHDHLPSPPGSCSVEVLFLESRCVYSMQKSFSPAGGNQEPPKKCVVQLLGGDWLAFIVERVWLLANQPVGWSRCKSRVFGRTADARGWI